MSNTQRPSSFIKIFLSTFFLAAGVVLAEDELPGLVKMCLFYPNESGHARTDPILNQSAPSDHVHTFYGPQNFHPDTSYDNLLNTKPEFSSSPFIENQSLYWHPSIYRVTNNNGVPTYSRVNNLDSSPYYRWNTNTQPPTVAFPPGFRMIAYSNKLEEEAPDDHVESLMVECCNFDADGEEDCSFTEGSRLIFPETACDFLGISLNMPTCWDESKGIGENNPFDHVAYTLDGTVSGECPDGYDKRIPEVQLFIRINNYKGGTYQLSNDSDLFHVDFMSGWQEGKLAKILEECQPSGEIGYNPPCGCDEFLTESPSPAEPVCDVDVREHILDEATDVVTLLPRASNSDLEIIPKTWTVDPPFDCKNPEVPCDDSTLNFKFRRRLISCQDVADRSSSLCKKALIKSHCPQTCNNSSFCMKDSKARFQLNNNRNRGIKNCRWVKKDSNRCQIYDMCNTCRKSCLNFNQCEDAA